jgi:hypothetical protein
MMREALSVGVGNSLMEILRRSSFCSYGSCVEVADRDRAVVVRSSDDPGRELSFTSDEWREFVRGVKAGEFDLPAEGHPAS